jgi:type IV secretory pathway TraG/TraD family ATPase VirD4
MSVFLCLSAPWFPVFNRWLRLVLASALDEMTDTLNPPALPVCFMLDELATLGHLQAVENAVGLAAGYGIQLWTVFQDVAQMRDLYKGRWSSFIGNAGVRAVFSLDDFDTAKYWSDFMGGHLVETASQSQDIYGLTKGQTKGETIRPLLSPEEIMLQFASKRRADGTLTEPEIMLVLTQGSHPIKTQRVAYFDDRSLDGLWDDPRGPATATPKIIIASSLNDAAGVSQAGKNQHKPASAPPSAPPASIEKKEIVQNPASDNVEPENVQKKPRSKSAAANRNEFLEFKNVRREYPKKGGGKFRK